MLCKEIMNKNLITCSLSTKVFEIAKIMKEKDIGFIPIVFNDKKTTNKLRICTSQLKFIQLLINTIL